MEKYQNKYRIKSARAEWWDYKSAGAYFVTICTKNRSHFFGHVHNGIMCLNDIGNIAQQEWFQTPIIRPDMNITLGAFVVMPNHIHGIITIGVNSHNQKTIATANKFEPQSKNLAAIIRGFKSKATKTIRLDYPEFGWQTRYHDHIIRDGKAYRRITNYIINNPNNWVKDKFHSSNQ